MNPDLDAIVFQRPISERSRGYLEDYAKRMCSFINILSDSEVVAPAKAPQAVRIAILSSNGITLESMESMHQYLLEKRRDRNKPTHARTSVSEHAPVSPDFITEKSRLKRGVVRTIGDRALVMHCQRSAQTFHAPSFVSSDITLTHLLDPEEAGHFRESDLNRYGSQFSHIEKIRMIKLEPMEVVHPRPAQLMEAA